MAEVVHQKNQKGREISNNNPSSILPIFVETSAQIHAHSLEHNTPHKENNLNLMPLNTQNSGSVEINAAKTQLIGPQAHTETSPMNFTLNPLFSFGPDVDATNQGLHHKSQEHISSLGHTMCHSFTKQNKIHRSYNASEYMGKVATGSKKIAGHKCGCLSTIKELARSVKKHNSHSSHSNPSNGTTENQEEGKLSMHSESTLPPWIFQVLMMISMPKTILKRRALRSKAAERNVRNLVECPRSWLSLDEEGTQQSCVEVLTGLYLSI